MSVAEALRGTLDLIDPEPSAVIEGLIDYAKQLRPVRGREDLTVALIKYFEYALGQRRAHRLLAGITGEAPKERWPADIGASEDGLPHSPFAWLPVLRPDEVRRLLRLATSSEMRGERRIPTMALIAVTRIDRKYLYDIIIAFLRARSTASC